MDEKWIPVPGYEDSYEVSNVGRIKSLARTVIRKNGRRTTISERIRKPQKTHKGYLNIILSKNGIASQHTVHSLVLTAFSGERPEGHVARHLNGDPSDNRIENLKWGTPSENQRDSLGHGTHYLANLTECKRGHSLSGKNLAKVNSNRRVCLACKREHDAARHEKRPFDDARSNLRYEDIMSDRVRHKSELRL